MIAALTGTLVGATLGLRFTVLATIPAMLLCAVAAGACVVGSDISPRQIFETFLIFCVTVQAGFVAAALGKVFVASAVSGTATRGARVPLH